MYQDTIYLPNGKEVSLAILETNFPDWFSSDSLQSISALMASEWRKWEFSSRQLRYLQQWARNYAHANGGDKRKWLMGALTGTALDLSVDPKDMLEMFEENPATARALFDPSVR